MKKPFKYIISAAVIALIFLLIWVFLFKKWDPEKPKEIKRTEIKIDSLQQILNSGLNNYIDISEREAKKSKEILKSIKHEKITVRDTTYDAMCKYIENYRPAK
jgi:hypothetical protein